MRKMQPGTRVIRDHAWVEREYNREKYPLVLSAAREALTREGMSLSQVVGRVCARECSKMLLSMHDEAIVSGAATQMPLLFALHGVAGFTLEALAEAVTPETETIVELGAGWGRNLFKLYLDGRVSRAAQFYALEFAETARMTAKLVASTEPGLKFEPLAFDYHAPNYSAIAPSDKPALVATIHSAEQIPNLKREVFTDLIARLPNLTGVHLEPVSFQLPLERRGPRPPCASAVYAAQHDYNRNLWPILAGLESDGIIEIEDVAADVVGLNTKNPGTYIRWRARRGPRARRGVEAI